VLGIVAAVINDDVKGFFSRSNVVPELRRSLVANDDLYSVASIRHAGGLDVDPRDMRRWPKVVAPHVEAAAAVDANLQDPHRLPTNGERKVS
jgi:hypothetical protein